MAHKRIMTVLHQTTSTLCRENKNKAQSIQHRNWISVALSRHTKRLCHGERLPSRPSQPPRFQRCDRHRVVRGVGAWAGRLCERLRRGRQMSASSTRAAARRQKSRSSGERRASAAPNAHGVLHRTTGAVRRPRGWPGMSRRRRVGTTAPRQRRRWASRPESGSADRRHVTGGVGTSTGRHRGSSWRSRKPKTVPGAGLSAPSAAGTRRPLLEMSPHPLPPPSPPPYIAATAAIATRGVTMAAGTLPVSNSASSSRTISAGRASGVLRSGHAAAGTIAANELTSEGGRGIHAVEPGHRVGSNVVSSTNVTGGGAGEGRGFAARRQQARNENITVCSTNTALLTGSGTARREGWWR